MREVYLLECEACNGEYGTNTHKSIHATKESALARFQAELDPEDLKGQDARNKWEQYSGSMNIMEFRTGNWGFVVWTLTTLPLHGDVAKEFVDLDLHIDTFKTLTMLPHKLFDECKIVEMVSFYDNPRTFLLEKNDHYWLYHKYAYKPEWEDTPEPKYENWLQVHVPKPEKQLTFKAMTTGQLREFILSSDSVDSINCTESNHVFTKLTPEVMLSTKHMLPPKDRTHIWDDGDDEDDE